MHRLATRRIRPHAAGTHQCRKDARARCADWMSERGRTAVHIELVRRNAEIISGDHRYHGEGFVDFE